MRNKTALLLAYFFTASALFFSSCKKDKETVNTPIKVQYPISGLWIGTQQGQNAGPQYYSLSIKPDFTITVDAMAQDQKHISTGTWSLRDSLFISEIKTVYGFYNNIGVVQTLTGIYHSDSREITDGKWVNTYLRNDSGRFEVKIIK